MFSSDVESSSNPVVLSMSSSSASSSKSSVATTPDGKREFLSISGTTFPKFNTFLVFVGFLGSLWAAYTYHWVEVCVESWPSLSATIGDRAPERNIFMMVMAWASVPKCFYIAMYYHLFKRAAALKKSSGVQIANKIFSALEFVRCLSTVGWVYITSSDSNEWHINVFVVYLVLSSIGKFLLIALYYASRQGRLTEQERYSLRWKVICCAGFHGFFLYGLTFYFRHMDGVCGEYEKYTRCEWICTTFDIFFEFGTYLDLKDYKLAILGPPTEKHE